MALGSEFFLSMPSQLVYKFDEENIPLDGTLRPSLQKLMKGQYLEDGAYLSNSGLQLPLVVCHPGILRKDHSGTKGWTA